MPDVHATLEFLANTDLYRTQRPFIFTPSQDYEDTIDTSREALITVELREVDVEICDIRGLKDYSLDSCGFEVVEHDTSNSQLDFMEESKRNAYCLETEIFLKDRFAADCVICYNVKVCLSPDVKEPKTNERSSYERMEIGTRKSL